MNRIYLQYVTKSFTILPVVNVTVDTSFSLACSKLKRKRKKITVHKIQLLQIKSLLELNLKIFFIRNDDINHIFSINIASVNTHIL